MRSFNQWMAEYGVSHQNPTNQLIHKICVPLIMLSVIGLIWSIPTPEMFKPIPYLNWATLFVLGCLVFYMTLNFMMFIGMLILTALMIWICQQLNNLGILLPASVAIFCGFLDCAILRSQGGRKKAILPAGFSVSTDWSIVGYALFLCEAWD